MRTQGPADGPTRSAGIREVAREARVSIGTVSNVLNHPDRVLKETRLRVEKAMKDLGFVRSRAAGQLRSRRSALVGVIVPDVGNPYWATVIRGIETVLDDAGLALIVGSTHQNPARQTRLLRDFESQGVDGLIVAPINGKSEWASFTNRRFGVVSLERRTRESSTSWVSLNNVAGARLAVTHLLERGHRRIAFVNGPLRVSWCAERHRGVREGLEGFGLDPDDALVELTVEDLTVVEGSEVAERLMLIDPKVSAVMCANDLLALGVNLGLRRSGLSIPRDIALVGYDDVDFAAALAPPLTTVRQPAFDVGRAAATLLLKGGSRSRGEHVEFMPELVVRDSSSVAR